jgi:hypothetical protein
MNLSALQTTLISLVGTIASVAVGFGAFSATKEQLVVSTAGTLISLGFQLYTELERRTKVEAAVANKDAAKLSKLSGN